MQAILSSVSPFNTTRSDSIRCDPINQWLSDDSRPGSIDAPNAPIEPGSLCSASAPLMRRPAAAKRSRVASRRARKCARQTSEPEASGRRNKTRSEAQSRPARSLSLSASLSSPVRLASGGPAAGSEGGRRGGAALLFPAGRSTHLSFLSGVVSLCHCLLNERRRA